MFSCTIEHYKLAYFIYSKFFIPLIGAITYYELILRCKIVKNSTCSK